MVKAFLDGYVPAFKDFLETSCRLATIEEASKFHQKFFDNARVGKVYSDGTFQIRRFYIVESHRDELLEKLDLKKENCSRKINREFVKLLEELCGEKFIYDGYAGCYHGQLFLFTNFAVVDNKSFFKICRKATSSETTKLSLFVKEKQESY